MKKSARDDRRSCLTRRRDERRGEGLSVLHFLQKLFKPISANHERSGFMCDRYAPLSRSYFTLSLQKKLKVNWIYLLILLALGLLFSPQTLLATPLEIPDIPMEISTFPNDLKTFCADPAYGIKDICDKLSHPSQLRAVDYMALKYIWGHERALKEGMTETQKKILKCFANKSKDRTVKCRDITQDMVTEGDSDKQVINYLIA